MFATRPAEEKYSIVLEAILTLFGVIRKVPMSQCIIIPLMNSSHVALLLGFV